MRQLRRTHVLIAVLLLSALPSGVRAVGLARDTPVTAPVTLFDFETEEQMAAWQMVGAGHIERSAERAYSGRYSVKIILRVRKEGDPAGPTGPSLGDLSDWSFAQLTYSPPADWSFFGGWRAKMFVESGGRFYHEVLDATGAKWWRPLRLADAQGQWATVEFPFTGGVDLSQIARQWFYRAGRDPEVTFYIDDIELTAPGPQWLDAFLRRRPEPPRGSAAWRASRPACAEVMAAVEHGRRGYERGALTLHDAQDLRSRLEQGVAEAHREARAAVAEGLMQATRRLNPGARHGVGVLDSMDRPYVRDLWFPARPASGVHLRLARGEREGFQVVVTDPEGDLSQCRVSATALTGLNGDTLPPPEVAVVGSFLTGRPGTYPVDYDGRHADVLLPPAPVDIPAGDFQAFWVRVDAPPDQSPGVYRGEVLVEAEGEAAVTLPLAVTVWPFTLPVVPTMQTALSFDEGQVAAVYGAPDRDMLRRYAEFLLRNRIDFTSIYRKTPPDPDLLQALHEQVRPFRFNVLGLNRWMAEISPEASEPHVRHVLTQIRAAVPELEKRGLLEYAYLYGFDELPTSRAENIARIAGAIRAEFPQIPILTTAHDPTYGAEGVLSEAMDAFCPRVRSHDAERAAAARESGKQVWWYFCQGVYHPYINWYLQYPLIEVRVLFGPMAARYRPDGVLYWTLNAWTTGGVPRPLEGGPLFDDIAPGWKGDHGEGLLLYPGPEGPLSSLRLENVRDGLEDYEYYALLESLLERVCVSGRATESGGAALLERARRLLAVNPAVVTDRANYTRDSGLWRRERQRLAEAIVALDKLLSER